MIRPVTHIYPILILLSFFFTENVLATNQAPPFFKGGSSIKSHAGYITLAWTSAEGGAVYEIEEKGKRNSHAATVIYRGKGKKIFISGLENGGYRYRVRSIGDDGSLSPWSQPLILQVKHHSIERALFLFFLGMIIFAVTCYVIIRGSRKEGKAHP